MSYQRVRLALWWNVGLMVVALVVLSGSAGLLAALFGLTDAAIVMGSFSIIVLYFAVVLGCIAGVVHLLRQAFGSEARK